MRTINSKWRSWLTALGCVTVSTAALYLSTGLGSQWLFAWLALAPLLWLAYGRLSLGWVAVATFAAFTFGNLGFLRPFRGMHAATLGALMAVLGLALAAAAAVSLARLVQRRNIWWLTLLGFPAIWVSIEYLSSLVSPNGTIGSLAYTQASVPVLIQSVSLLGIWSITFLICLVANGTALVLRSRARALPIAGVVALVFVANLAFGISRLHDHQPQTVKVAAIVKDQPSQRFQSSQQAWLGITTAYATEIGNVVAANRGVATIVLPEKLATLSPEWRDAVLRPLARAAQDNHVRIVAGFEDDTSGASGKNIAIVFHPSGSAETYAKRQLLASENNLTPGNQALLLDGGTTVIEICKDMDFPQMIRADAQNQHAGMALVPAEDFSVDKFDLLHARIATMRGVEDGFSVVRAARKGDVTMSDSRGRILVQAHSTETQFVARVANIPIGNGGTMYDKIGDGFAWICLGWSVVALGYVSVRLLRK